MNGFHSYAPDVGSDIQVQLDAFADEAGQLCGKISSLMELTSMNVLLSQNLIFHSFVILHTSGYHLI